MNNKSYQQIFDQFNVMFPEFTQNIVGWDKCLFKNDVRMVVIRLENGCYIYFGTTKDDDDEWTWIASLYMSDKTQEILGVTAEE